MSTETIKKEKTVVRTMPMYRVIYHNDDKTSMEFVVMSLISIYHHEPEKAMELTMQIHEEGQGIAGTYPLEVAELKQEQTISLARGNGFPLCVTIEPAE